MNINNGMIVIFGRGRIGTAIQKMLTDAGQFAATWEVGEYDDKIFDNYNVFICATPFEATREIAKKVGQREGKLYFDLTEDVEVGKQARENSKSIMVPHCGLAPGAVSILAASLNPTFSLNIDVGALPVTPTGHLGYSLTWSTDGLINEYIKPCPVITAAGAQMKNALDGFASAYTVGESYESFYTSGGIGTLCDTNHESRHLTNIAYRTIRYAGHRNIMHFLLNDLKFRDRPQELVDLLDKYLPRGGDDKVIINIETDFPRKQLLMEIFGKDGMSAIQRTTAAGVTAVVLWCIDNFDTLKELIPPSRKGLWIANEDIPREELKKYKCWNDVYEQATTMKYEQGSLK